jgi:hypothetical protein
MKIIDLTQKEYDCLFEPLAGKGGFQSFIRSFQKATEKKTKKLILTDYDIERIPRYAYAYNQGGWQDRLEKIFKRSLGADLGKSKYSQGYPV